MLAHRTAPTLETERLRLRAHRLSDFEASAAMWADPEVVRHISGVPFTGEASWARLLRYVGHWALLGFGYWVLEEKRSGTFVGEIGFADHRRDLSPSPPEGMPEAGWALAPAHHGRGLASEALACAIRWADANIDAPGSFCILDPAHTASIRVARKAGYAGDRFGHYRDQPILILLRETTGRPVTAPPRDGPR